jgi:hypothetical protein
VGFIVRLLKPMWTYSGRSILDLDENTLDEYLDLCQKGLVKRETLRSGRDGSIRRMRQDG